MEFLFHSFHVIGFSCYIVFHVSGLHFLRTAMEIRLETLSKHAPVILNVTVIFIVSDMNVYYETLCWPSFIFCIAQIWIWWNFWKRQSHLSTFSFRSQWMIASALADIAKECNGDSQYQWKESWEGQYLRSISVLIHPMS